MLGRTKKWVVAIAVVLLLGVGLLVYRYWQGPLVTSYQLVRQPLVQHVVATGRVVSTSRAQVGSEITSVVTDRLVREGDRVAAGDILIRLQADELFAKAQEARAAMAQLKELRRPQAQARLRQAEAELAQAQREVKRRQMLLAENATPREEKEKADQALVLALAAVEQARLEVESLKDGQSEVALMQARLDAAEAALSRSVLRAEFSGLVLTRHVEPGDLVQPGKVLLEIARDEGLEILVPVDERNLNVLKVGQPAICIADAYPYQQFQAEVQRIAPAVDPQRGTVDVRLTIDGVPDYLREDLTVTATVETGRRAGALVVPNDALFNRQGLQASVWRVRRGRVSEARVTLGLQGVAMTEVRAGLQEGDWVSAATDLTEGQRVRRSASLLAPAKASSERSREAPLKLD